MDDRRRRTFKEPREVRSKEETEGWVAHNGLQGGLVQHQTGEPGQTTVWED